MRKNISFRRLIGMVSLLLLFEVMTACGNVENPSMETTQSAENQSESEGNVPEESGVSSEAEENVIEDTENTESIEAELMKVTIGDTVFTATLADNSSAQALAELLREGPLTIDMHDYANMEKVGPIGQSLPENNEQITTGPGDIILYLGDSLVIYYDTNSWDFTRIGKINDVTQEELLAAMGSGNVSVTFELEE
ncbi:MAG: cyclophilin-like fold protein [Eubacteriales bacterium]|nr:cyclophilin-like fold protein [Eubacteriales bacterium]